MLLIKTLVLMLVNKHYFLQKPLENPYPWMHALISIAVMSR
jgi:hypothetical protein